MKLVNNIEGNKDSADKMITGDETFGDRDDNSKTLQDTQECQSLSFAKCEKSPEHLEQNKNTFQKALIGFWRASPPEMVCYR